MILLVCKDINSAPFFRAHGKEIGTIEQLFYIYNIKCILGWDETMNMSK